MEKLPFETYRTHLDVNHVPIPIEIKRAEIRDELLQVPELEESCFYEKEKGDCGYIYEPNEVLELDEYGEFFLVYALQELIGYTSVAFGEKANPKISTREGDAYYAGSVLKPQWRRRGLSQHMNRVREDRAHTYDAARILTCLVANNVSSLMALSKSGFVIHDTADAVFSANEVVNGDRLVMAKSLKNEVNSKGKDQERHRIVIPMTSAQDVYSEVRRLLSREVLVLEQHVEAGALHMKYVFAKQEDKD